MATLSDNEALLSVGQILAGFLKEYLPPDDRWSRFVSPALANTPNAPRAEVPLDELDLSALLQVFLGNRDYLRSRNVFRTTLPFNCAFCVRNMRNSRAHQSHATAISDDERLFDLNLLRRFTLLIDNRATEPGLIDGFLTGLDAAIVEVSNRCFGDVLAAEQPSQMSMNPPSQPTPQIDGNELKQLVGDVVDQMKHGFDQVGRQLEGLKLLANNDGFIGQGANPESAPLPLPDPTGPMIDQLNVIDAKIDRLLADVTVETIEVETQAVANEPHQETELLSGLEAKGALRSLRAQFATEFPNTDPTHALLRQTMVDLFLANRIDSIEKFEAIIPEVMKADTDPSQMVLLPKVFEVVNRLR